MTPLYGLDISDYQAGMAIPDDPFIILKASEGETWRSSTVHAWRDEAGEKGMVVGLYHFLRANTPTSEVVNFLRVIGELRPNEFAVCDWEADEASTAHAIGWCAGVEYATGRRPVLYSYGPFLAARPTINLAVRYPLWIAAYGPNDGAEHGSPTTDLWTPFEDGPGEAPFEGRTVMWQFTSNPLDRNKFLGTVADLRGLCGDPAGSNLALWAAAAG